MNVQRARLGFTMVELVLVLAIISVLAGIAVPRFAAASVRHRLKAAAHRVAADVQLARATARARSATVAVNFIVGAGGYCEIPAIKGMEGAATHKTDLWADPYRVTLKRADFGGVSTLSINGFGIGKTGSVEVMSGGYVCRVDVDGDSGVVRVIGP